MIVRIANYFKFQKVSMLTKNCFASDKQLYLMMLQTYRKTMKKPTLEQKNTQMKIISNILDISEDRMSHSDSQSFNAIEKFNEKREKQIITYLIQLRHFRLYSTEALVQIQKFINTHWSSLQKYEKICCTTLLVEQGYYQIFYRFQKQHLSLSDNLNSDKKQIVGNVLYRYCKTIVNKNISYEKMWGNEIQKQTLNKLFQTQFKLWLSQYQYISKINWILHQNGLKNNQIILKEEMISKLNKDKKRSNLQIQIQSLLCTLGYSFSREVSILGYNVDFVVNSKSTRGNTDEQLIKSGKIILEVMGSHHITCEHKIFGKDIIRALILQKCMPLAMVHANDFNVIKGIQNKLHFLQTIIERKLKQKKHQRHQYRDWNPSIGENQDKIEIKMNQYKEHSKKLAQKLQFDIKNK